MPRLLVVYGTTDGHTAKIAAFVAAAVRSRGFAVDLCEASDAPTAGDYGAVMVAASVHAGGYQRAVGRWIACALPLLSSRPSAFLSVCLGILQHDAAVDADLRAIRQRLLSRTGWQPDETKAVAGALPYTKYGWIRRYAMRRIVSKAGGDTDTSRDFEYTDWSDLREFVDGFVDRHATRMAAAGQSAGTVVPTPASGPFRRWLVRTALGTTLVLHGLANAVLPMRAVDAVAPGVWAPANAALYLGAIAGFVGAGLGVMGVRPLRSMATSLAAAASLCALVAHIVLRSGDLWVGIALSLTLPIAVWLWASAESRCLRSRAGAWRAAGDALGLALVAWVAVAAGFWPHYRTWGASPQEWRLSLPGDRSPRHPEFEILSGVTVAAPPDAVWPWLAQMGQDRAGFYSYDRLERLFGADIHNTLRLRPDWQTRHAGDLLPATQVNYLGGLFGARPGWKVVHFEPGRSLVLENWGAFVLMPTADGRTRFLIRSTISNGHIPAWAAAINLAAFELPHFIMQRRMMLTIKELAERPA